MTHKRRTATVGAAITAGLLLSVAPVASVGASAAAAAPVAPANALGLAHAHLAAGQPLLKYYGGTNGGTGVGKVGVQVTQGVYLVFWGSQWSTTGDPFSAAPYLQSFLGGLFGSQDTWSTSTTQYCQGIAKKATKCSGTATFVTHPTASPLLGVWSDSAALAPPQATNAQLGQEADAAAVHFGNTTPASNASKQYVIVSPHGTFPGGFNLPGTGWCAWHDFTGGKDIGVITPRGNIAFTNLPYQNDAGTNCGQGFVNTPGLLDGWSIVEGHEYAETITDLWPQAPIGATNLTSGGWFEPVRGENGDKCAWITPGTPGGAADIKLTTGTFAVQSLWSNAANNHKGGCVITYP